MSKSLRDLQALRGAACLVVVLHHVGGLEAESAWRYRLLGSFEALGFAGVDVFFVLSGFIICHANRTRLGQPKELRQYLLDRLWRVYPTYWACFLGITVLFHWVLDACYYPGYFRHTLFHALLVPQSGPNFVVPQAWTLSFEVMFYLLFGVLFLLPRRFAPAFLSGWFLAAVVCSVAVRPADPMTLMPLSPYTLEFLLGCLAAVILAKKGSAFGTASVIAGACWVAGATITLHACGLPRPGGEPLLRLVCFGVPALLLVYGLAARESAGVTTLPRWLRPVGDASYSIYLLHLAVLWGFKRAGVFEAGHALPVQLFLLAIQVGACCAAGWLVYRAVERPLMAWRKRAKARSRVAVPPVLSEVRRAA